MHTRLRSALVAAGAIVATGLSIISPPAAHAAGGETFQVTAVTTTGCASGNFGMTVAVTNFDAPTYFVHTTVTGGGFVYMNEKATGTTNATTSWHFFNNFSYGIPANQGTWPIPNDVPLQVDFTVERPLGTVLYSWRLNVDSCNVGTVKYNNQPSLDTDNDFIAAPTDQCPGAAAPTVANGCPQFSRAVTFDYKLRARKIHGALTGTGLIGGRQVQIYLKKGNKLVATVTTAANGRYSLKKRLKTGKYFAVAPALIDPNVGQAAEARSARIKITDIRR